MAHLFHQNKPRFDNHEGWNILFFWYEYSSWNYRKILISKRRKTMKSHMSSMYGIVNLGSIQNSDLRGDLIERAKNASHNRSTDIVIFFGMIVQKILIKITDVFWFLETFSPLISFAPFALFIRFEKSLQNQKNQWSQRFFWRSPKKNCQFRDLYIKILFWI